MNTRLLDNFTRDLFQPCPWYETWISIRRVLIRTVLNSPAGGFARAGLLMGEFRAKAA